MGFFSNIIADSRRPVMPAAGQQAVPQVVFDSVDPVSQGDESRVPAIASQHDGETAEQRVDAATNDYAGAMETARIQTPGMQRKAAPAAAVPMPSSISHGQQSAGVSPATATVKTAGRSEASSRSESPTSSVGLQRAVTQQLNKEASLQSANRIQARGGQAEAGAIHPAAVQAENFSAATVARTSGRSVPNIVPAKATAHSRPAQQELSAADAIPGEMSHQDQMIANVDGGVFPVSPTAEARSEPGQRATGTPVPAIEAMAYPLGPQAPVSRDSIRQQMAQPQVRIGQVNVVVQQPAVAKSRSTIGSHQDDVASRNFLRGF